MTRATLLITFALSILVAPLAADAQSLTKVHRIGVVFPCRPQKIHPHAKPLVANQRWTTTLPAATIVGDDTHRFKSQGLQEKSRR
jgi:hypothetical protein